jgi:putative SOS response-associated peptidase YedK
MCGRIALYSDPPRLARLLESGLDPDLVDGVIPHWNVGPTATILGARESSDGHRVLRAYRWGLVPKMAKDGSAAKGTFNARAETVATKLMFRDAFVRGRALIPADGFFEWKTAGKVKQPYYFHRADGLPMVFAGLTEYWRAEGADAIHSATIITTQSGSDMDGIHDRMPVILEQGAWDHWLDPDLFDRDDLESMLHPAPQGTLVHHPVGPEVGNIRNDRPQLLEPAPEVTPLSLPW